ncbi:MAG: MurR/RpiR family transcriptional regulator [Pseudomonadota bacterium]
MTATHPPQSVEDFHRQLGDMSQALPKRLKQCADYLAAHSGRIALSTVAELAAGAKVQPSAMMRFCQIMGFSGFSEMQKLFRESGVHGFPDYASRLAKLRDRGSGSPSALLAEFVDAGRTSLENLANTVDLKVLDQSAKTLAQANMIHVIGLRRSFPVASYLAYAFDKMEIPAMLHDAVGKLTHAHAVRSGDALIAITFAPYSQETLALAEECNARGVPVVAITDAITSPLLTGEVLPLRVSEVDFGDFRALSATLSLAITLAISVGTQRNT